MSHMLITADLSRKPEKNLKQGLRAEVLHVVLTLATYAFCSRVHRFLCHLPRESAKWWGKRALSFGAVTFGILLTYPARRPVGGFLFSKPSVAGLHGHERGVGSIVQGQPWDAADPGWSSNSVDFKYPISER
jgi:hypothetical protein